MMSDSQKELLKALGKRIKDIRTEKDLTLKELAHKIDKEPQSIHRLETGGVNPSYLYLLDICRGLDIDVAELLHKVKG
ncbi:MAG: helix-turn-helix transcriptional regulator [Taibaiella sp.]|jgi:transcriptional regulator with XRE-family HTH domain